MPKKSGFTTFSLHERGFTLIELLIVITIIAILSAIGLVAYSQITRGARDAKRKSDLKLIQSALEQYNSDQKFYPAISGGWFNNTTYNSVLTNCSANGATSCTVTKTYLNNVPTDPSSSQPQYCLWAFNSNTTNCAVDASNVGCDNLTTSTNCLTYCVYAKLENPPAGSSTYTCGGNTYNYAVTSP